ncbi:MAG: hypothetical protein ACC652_05845, partial [Acidimicrobiales bacterium]
WIAGLYVAGLSLSRTDNKDQFINEFSGSQRHLMDYLTSEVLDQQPADVRRFLLETSIVDEQHPDLCNAITGRSDSAAVLRRPESENQFVQALDEHRRSFRYHRVFSDVLREILAQEAEADTAELYGRAASWCLAGGHIAGAIHHQIRGENYQDAVSLIIKHWIDFSNEGAHFTAFAFLGALPEEVVNGNVDLIARAAWATLNLRDYTACERWLSMLEETAPEAETATHYTSPVRAHLARHHGQTSDMLHFGQLAMDHQDHPVPQVRAAARATLALGYFWTGDHEKSAIEFELSISEGTEDEEISSIVIGDSYLAFIEARAGNYADALIHIERVGQYTDSKTLERFQLASMAHIAAAEVALSTGRYEQAEAALNKAAEL